MSDTPPMVLVAPPRPGELTHPIAMWPPIECAGCKAMHALGYRHLASGEFRCVDCHAEGKS